MHRLEDLHLVLFETALRLARNRGLLESGGSEVADARREFALEVRDAVRRVDIVVALAAGRRAGFQS